MDASKKQQLIEAGIDVDGALERFMGNEALLGRFLHKFLNDTNFDKLQNAVAEHSLDDAITASHTLKGVCGNLSMTRMFDLLTGQVAAFRAGDWDRAVGMLPDISAAYYQTVKAIRG